MIIAIDGPAGAGKSSTARDVAHQLGFAYIDTGAMYRAVALVAAERGLALPADADRIATLGHELPLHFGAGGTRLFVGPREISGQIRSPEVGRSASQVAAVPALRANVVARQQELGRLAEQEFGGAVLEGRDIQTVVFPEAEVKIFLTASTAVRASRRLQQWQEKSGGGQAPEPGHDLAAATADVVDRDERDESREHSPLRPCPNAVHLSTDDLTPEEVTAAIVKIARERLAEPTLQS